MMESEKNRERGKSEESPKRKSPSFVLFAGAFDSEHMPEYYMPVWAYLGLVC